MKIQTILSLAMATVALFASCSSDEILDVPVDKTIQFSGAFVDNSTRAIINESSDLTEFNVYGWETTNATTPSTSQIFDEEPVSYDKSTWSYENIQYWVEGYKYNFSAIAGGNGTISVVGANNTVTDYERKITSFTSDGKTDLLYAATSEITAAATNNPVAFTFEHQLAKVKFSFLNSTSGSSIQAKITDIKITNAYETGDVVLSSDQYGASWSNQSGTLLLEFGDASSNPIGTTTATASEKEFLLIPSTSYTYTVQFTTEIIRNNETFKTVTREATITPELVAGYAYNFTAELNEDNIDPENALKAIEFTASVTNWPTPTDVTVPASGSSVTIVTQ
jgi:hypothetical protein